MTEREKSLAGVLYSADDPELVALCMKARKLVYKYNKSKPHQAKLRDKLIKKLFGKTGEKILVEAPVYCDYGCNIEVGENFFANFGCTMLDENMIKIGKNCMIGPNVGLYTAAHPVRAEERYNGVELCKTITIGDNCWIGGGAIINPGVTIGDNVVVASGSVVTKSFGSNLVIGGDPARIIREL